MPRIHMPPTGITGLHGTYIECMVFGDPLEIAIDKAGDLVIDDPDFFTETLGHGGIFAPAVLGQYYPRADYTQTHFHFTVSATGRTYDVELQVKDACP